MEYNTFDFSEKLLDLSETVQDDISQTFKNIEKTEEYNGMKVLNAFIKHGVTASHLCGTSGYGYGDLGRDTLEKVFADAFGAQDALVRHSFACGTHALTVALFGILRPNDTLLSVTGIPYDTLQSVVGLTKSDINEGTLIDFGIKYDQVDLLDGKIDIKTASQKVSSAKVAYFQRSRGYSLRPSLSVDEICNAAKQLKKINTNVIIMVDNCYGEFTEIKEPCSDGADLIIGSLIKNPGGAIARTGGYIAGRHDLVELCGYRLSSPGTGREVGCSLDELRNMYLGFFMSPSVVANALKTAVFASRIFEKMGYDVTPKYNEARHDIIQAICLNKPEALCKFCEGIQSGSPIDSTAIPEPWEMPGYDSKVIMAAGAFTNGASIELSADAPMRPPYAVWLQGGITYPAGKAGIMLAAQKIIDSEEKCK